MTKAILSGKFPEFADKLRNFGYQIIPSETVSCFINYERDHADMQCLIIEDTAFVLSCCQRLAKSLENDYKIVHCGDNITGNVSASDFGKYTASGKANESLNYPLAQHIRKLNLIRRAVTALQKGQYTTSNVSNSNMAFTRRYTANGLDSLACVTISGGATFNNLPNGKYIDAVTGDVKNVSNGTLSVPSVGSANMRVYVCCAPGFEGISGRIGDVGTYLK